MRITPCRACGAPMIFIRTPAGRAVPCDADGVKYWQNDNGKDIVITPKGEVVRADLQGDEQQATGIGYITHFATCPKADMFRKR